MQNIISCLPQRIAEQFMKYDISDICEIRIYENRPMVVTVSDRCIPFGDSLSSAEMSQTLSNLCSGSLHTYEDTLKNGYVPLENGCRAGVCGRMSAGNIVSVSSICIRIPRSVYGVGASLCKQLMTTDGGMLIYSPPGVGKTTLLRDIASTLSSPPYLKRVSVIDTRCEIYRQDAFLRSIADIFLNYEKGQGIELAVRTMSPQYVVCDELGAQEAEAVLNTQSFGVPLIATAHAPSLPSLLQRKTFFELDKSGVFSLYVGISRQGKGFSFDITERKKPC